MEQQVWPHKSPASRDEDTTIRESSTVNEPVTSQHQNKTVYTSHLHTAQPSVRALHEASSCSLIQAVAGASHAYPDHNQLLPSEDVEHFFNYLEKPHTAPPYGSSYSHGRGKEVMFQNVTMQSPAQAYQDTPSSVYLHSNNPVYVPTTRTLLPMQYNSGGHVAQGNSVWYPQQQDPVAYSVNQTHHHPVSPRVSFPPSPPISSPATLENGFGSSRQRTANGLAYGYVTHDAMTAAATWPGLESGLRVNSMMGPSPGGLHRQPPGMTSGM